MTLVNKILHCITLLCLLLVVQQSYVDAYYNEELTCDEYCDEERFECIHGNCVCVNGYRVDRECLQCPGLGEKCHGFCCSKNGHDNLSCWQGVCRFCFDRHGNWICRDTMDQILLISITQVVMATALVLGIIATFVLLYKLCAASNLRPLGIAPANGNRLSVGSLQLYIDERLRDAPPKYTRSAPTGSSIYPAATFENAGFVHDNTVPPPAYTPERTLNESQNVTNHI